MQQDPLHAIIDRPHEFRIASSPTKTHWRDVENNLVNERRGLLQQVRAATNSYVQVS